jgi:hypothetical protein
MNTRIPETWDEAAPEVLPVLRRVTEPNVQLVAELDGDDALVRRHALPFLHTLIAIDRPEYRIFVKHSHLATWGVDADHAFQRAWLSLDPVAGLRQRDDQAALWQLDSEDGYQVSRLLLPRWLASFTDRVEGRPVAIAPHGRLLRVGGSENLAQVDALHAIAGKAFRAAGGQLSPVLYTVDDDAEVVPWVPDNDHPMAGPLAASRAWLCAWEYDQQRYLLEDVLLTPLARATLVRRGRGGFTYCSWRPGDKTLLPVTDFVVMGLEDSGYLVPWPAVEALAGSALTDADMTPRRMKTGPLPVEKSDEFRRVGIRISANPT